MANISNINVQSEDYDVKDSLAREHIADKNNPHEISAEMLGLGQLKDKAPADILNDLSKDNVIKALQYTPANVSVEQNVSVLQDKIEVLEKEVEKDPLAELDINIGLEVTDDGTLNVINHGSIHMSKGDSVTRAEINKLNEQVRELFQFVSDVRMKLAAAITDRGIYTRPDASFDEIINNIYQIKGNNSILQKILIPTTNIIKETNKLKPLSINEIQPIKIFTPQTFKEYLEEESDT